MINNGFVDQLTQAAGLVAENKLPRVLLVHGLPGTPKHYFVRALAKHIIMGDYPSSVRSFAEIHAYQDGFTSPFITQVVPESSSKQITIEQVRPVIESFRQTTQSEKGQRVCLIQPADQLNASAANALLKILEESTDCNYFILACQSLENLLPTIKSRCSVIHLQAEPGLISASDLPELLTKSGQSCEHVEKQLYYTFDCPLQLLDSNDAFDLTVHQSMTDALEQCFATTRIKKSLLAAAKKHYPVFITCLMRELIDGSRSGTTKNSMFKMPVTLMQLATMWDLIVQAKQAYWQAPANSIELAASTLLNRLLLIVTRGRAIHADR
jgi:hypothetical protein